MISVTQVQQEMLAAELHKRRQAEHLGHDLSGEQGSGEGGRTRQLPSVPKPSAEHIAWAKRTMRDGYQASPADRAGAMRILDVAGLSSGDFHGGKEPDTAPPGVRDIAGAKLELDQAVADRHARKAANVRGFEDGPSEGVMPGHPEPADYERPYVAPGHAAPSPQAEAPRANPMPLMQHVVLPGQPRAAAIPPHVIEHFTMGSPSERGR